MSFQLINTQQMAINDSLLSLTEREIKYLKDSWAQTFSKKIFPSQKYFEEHNEIIKALKTKIAKEPVIECTII